MTLTHEPITSFEQDGEHLFLSNFYASPFKAPHWTHIGAGVIDPVLYDWATVEHYYQAAKTPRMSFAEQIREMPEPRDAKRRGRRVSLRGDWEWIKLDVMRYALEQKFACGSDLAGQLVATGDAMLVEGNTWKDHYWGVCGGTGKNWLGHLLMARRAELRA